MARRLISIVFLAAAVLGLSSAAWAQGCSGCRAAMEFSTEGRVMGASLNSGILMLMGAPYAILGAFGVAVYRAHRRGRKNPEEQ